jgi:hypothetical protein
MTGPLSVLELYRSTYNGPLLTLDAGVGKSTTQMARAIGQPLLKLGKLAYSTSPGDYFGFGLGYAPSLTDKCCCEIGCTITNTTGNEYGD